MSEAGLKPARLTWSGEWFDVWRRDDPYNYVYDVYFDRETHELLWVDNPNTTLTPIDTDPFDRKSEIVASDPGRYDMITPLTHSEHAEIFHAWVSGWPEEVRDKCDARSLEGFLDCLKLVLPEKAQGARAEWSAYHEGRLKTLAAAWLRQRGFAVEWDG
jgi:hypothetical protein